MRRYEVGIPARDGAELVADLYLPDDARVPDRGLDYALLAELAPPEERRPDAGEPVPAIVHVTPYHHEWSFLLEEAAAMVERGFAYLIVDARGRGRSDGVWRAFATDGDDGHDVVEWVGTQPWCTGRVGLSGGSYSGWNQWAIARTAPPHLAAMAAGWTSKIWNPSTGGVFELCTLPWLLCVRRRREEDMSSVPWPELYWTVPLVELGGVFGEDCLTWQDWKEHPVLDEYRLTLVPSLEECARIDVPALHITGWLDCGDLESALPRWESMVAASPAADRQWLVVGPWQHCTTEHCTPDYNFGEESEVGLYQLLGDFFDRWLRDGADEAWSPPRTRTFVTGIDRWRAGSVWPPEVVERRLPLGRHEDGGTLDEVPAHDTTTYRYDPADPTPTAWTVSSPGLYFHLDQRAAEQRPDVVTFSTAPLESSLTIAGRARLELAASISTNDTDWHVKLTDVSPDGVSRRVAFGLLRAACRADEFQPQPVTPGKVERYTINLSSADHCFVESHRIRASITGSDFPMWGRNLNVFAPPLEGREMEVAECTIHHGNGHETALVLPVIESSTTEVSFPN